MKIDLDAVVSAILPAPILLTLGGKDYTVREMKLADVLLLETLGQAGDAETVAFVKSMFKGNAPPVLDELLKLSSRLSEIRTYVVEDLPKAVDAWAARAVTPNELITSADVIKVLGALPAPIADFEECEQKYLAAVNILGVITSSITMAVMETTPKNALTAAVKLISRQITAQRPSDDSPE